MTAVSYLLIGLFSLLLIVQCATKYEFLPREFRKVIRSSSRSSSLLLVYVLSNEFFALLDSSLASLILLNLTAAMLLLYFLLVEEFETQVPRKLQLAFLVSNLWLVFLTDLNYLTNLVIPFFLFPLTAPLIVTPILLGYSLTIRSELDNINKWTTPADMLKYCQGLRRLVAEPDDTLHRLLISGYCDIHRQKCEEVTCPIRMEAKALDKLRVFNAAATRNKRTEVILVEELVKKIYSQGVRFFSNHSSLGVEFALFLYQRGMKEQALKELL